MLFSSWWLELLLITKIIVSSLVPMRFFSLLARVLHALRENFLFYSFSSLFGLRVSAGCLLKILLLMRADTGDGGYTSDLRGYAGDTGDTDILYGYHVLIRTPD